MNKLGDIQETKDALETLKNERKTKEFLHRMYISAVRGGIYEYIELNAVYGVGGLTMAWCDMQYYISELSDLEMITEDEYTDLIICVNDTYMKACEKISTKGGNANGKGERRCNTNCRRDTRGNGTSRKDKDYTNEDDV